MKCCNYNNVDVEKLQSASKCPSVKDEEGPRRCW